MRQRMRKQRENFASTNSVKNLSKHAITMSNETSNASTNELVSIAGVAKEESFCYHYEFGKK